MIGKFITEMRQKQDKTLTQLAQQLGISKQYLSDIERGNRHPVDATFLFLLANVLEVNRDYLCYLAGIIPPDIRRLDLSIEQVAAGFAVMRNLQQEPDLFHDIDMMTDEEASRHFDKQYQEITEELYEAQHWNIEERETPNSTGPISLYPFGLTPRTKG